MCVYSVMSPCGMKFSSAFVKKSIQSVTKKLIFFDTGFNETALTPEQKVAVEFQNIKDMPGSSDVNGKKKEKPVFKAQEGYDLMEYYEFYKDLEPSNKHGRSWVVGKIFDIVGG